MRERMLDITECLKAATLIEVGKVYQHTFKYILPIMLEVISLGLVL
jgi:hypothetical protein